MVVSVNPKLKADSLEDKLRKLIASGKKTEVKKTDEKNASPEKKTEKAQTANEPFDDDFEDDSPGLLNIASRGIAASHRRSNLKVLEEDLPELPKSEKKESVSPYATQGTPGNYTGKTESYFSSGAKYSSDERNDLARTQNAPGFNEQGRVNMTQFGVNQNTPSEKASYDTLHEIESKKEEELGPHGRKKNSF